MNQRELIRIVSDRTGKTRKSISQTLECMVDVMSENILEGNKVSITRLGTFKKKTCRGRLGYDPYRKISVSIPPTEKITFGVNKGLKEKIERR